VTPAEREKERIQLIASYQRTFNTDDGKRVLEHLKKATNFYRAHNPQNLIVEEAKRALVLEIIENVKSEPDEPRQATAITSEG
jgi:hypothetical protein